MRGGSWNNNDNNARAANRNRNEPDNRNNNIGFRLVLPPKNIKRRNAGSSMEFRRVHLYSNRLVSRAGMRPNTKKGGRDW
ncbi:MAG TPA: SUMF1/EgtB/PvdO family nonheme iron enzyme [Desulfuromonadales bacterium]|nr:SUMF1/EgtB/PvdO family nonheme iron enzyme [Desulfuromonadales bacterium]